MRKKHSMNEDEIEDSLLDGAMIMDPEEIDHLQSEAFDAGYRRAVEFVKKEIAEGDPHKNIDLFLAWLVEGMMEDWSKN